MKREKKLEKVGPGHPLYNLVGISTECSFGEGNYAKFTCCGKYWCEDCFILHLQMEHQATLIRPIKDDE